MKSIFSCNEDVNKTAYMNWRTHSWDSVGNLVVIAEGFEQAAKRLITGVLIDNSSKDADILIFPILYSIDQSIELYLKAILYKLEFLDSKKPSNYTTHDILQLFMEMKSKVQNRHGNKQEFAVYLSGLQEYLDELYKYIRPQGVRKPAIDFARYPFDTNRNPHFYVATTENVMIDLENLLSRIEEIFDILDGLYLMCEEELEALQECQS